MRRLAVDAAALAAAMDEPEGGPVRVFLDLATGALEYVPRADPDEPREPADGGVAALFADVLDAPERWVEVPPLPAWRRHQLRTRFADEVDDVHARLRLLEALDDQAALAQFDLALRRVPALLDAWTRFRGRALAGHVRSWLASIEIERATLV